MLIITMKRNIDKSNMPESQKSLPADAQQPGYPIIKDANGDNKITIDDVKMRNTLPKIHIGFGNTFVSHDGGVLLERYLESLAQVGQFVFVTVSGNEGDSG